MKSAQLILSFLVIAGDAHHAAMAGGGKVGVFIDESLPHARRMLLVDAEQDRLLEALVRLPAELRDPPCHQVIDHQSAVEAPLVVDAIRNQFAAGVNITP